MAAIQLERTLVKSPPEIWDEIMEGGLSRCLGEVEVKAATAPARLEWSRGSAAGVVELVASGWGTRVRAEATVSGLPWDRVNARRDTELALRNLLDHLGSSSLKKQ
ncbi:MAG: hypothetical protein ACRDLQ_00070 [Solirubrobacterales bacterium]